MTGTLTLDTNVLVALERNDRLAWTRLQQFVRNKGIPIVPTAVIAEAWRGGTQARLARAVAFCQVVPLDERLARRAGELCARAQLHDPIDAVVVVTASAVGGNVWSDDPDIQVLATHLPASARSVSVEHFA